MHDFWEKEAIPTTPPAAPDFIFLAILVVQFLSVVFVLRWLIARIAGIRLPVLWCLLCIIANTYASSAFHALLLKMGGCAANNTNFVCHSLTSTSTWNMTLFLWQTPIYALVVQLAIHISKKHTVPKLRALAIAAATIAYGKACFILIDLLYLK